MITFRPIRHPAPIARYDARPNLFTRRRHRPKYGSIGFEYFSTLALAQMRAAERVPAK